MTPRKNFRKGKRFPKVPLSSVPPNRAGLVLLRDHAAGIDAHSREHYVAVPPGSVPAGFVSPLPNLPPYVRVFPTDTRGLEELASWLVACGIETVAVESTGIYHLAMVDVVQRRGIEVIVVDARQTASAPGRPKTDVEDCQWIQRLHSCGLLRPSFVPPPEIRALRAYERQRDMLVRYAAAHVQHMQKALELMNCKLTEVISDIVGHTGLLIVRAIVRGVRDPVRLSAYRHFSCKASREDIARALEGTWQKEYVFELKQALHLYDEYRARLSDCEEQIARCLASFADRSEGREPAPRPRRRSKAKNAVRFDARGLLMKMAGVDVTALEGIDESTALTLLSELGFDLSAFPTERNFTSWLGLSPNHRGSGGKVKRRQVKPSATRANRAFRLAASGCHHAKNALGSFYRRIASRSGGAKAIVATARKIAERFWRLLTGRGDYVRQAMNHYEEAYRLKLTRGLAKRAQELGYQLTPIGPSAETPPA
jgi:transposase